MERERERCVQPGSQPPAQHEKNSNRHKGVINWFDLDFFRGWIGFDDMGFYMSLDWHRFC